MKVIYRIQPQSHLRRMPHEGIGYWTWFYGDPQSSKSAGTGCFSYCRAVANGLDCFVEASVVHAERLGELGEQAQAKNLVIAPSCTMQLFPGPQRVRALVEEGRIGKVLSLNYHVGQYLPDWHPWEDVSDYYVSNKETGGCREIVPFELTWLIPMLGFPEILSCHRSRLGNLGVDIDDHYQFMLQFPNCPLANITIDVLAQPAVRELRLVGTEGSIRFSGDSNEVQCYSKDDQRWDVFSLDKGTVEQNYINPEEPYIEEIRLFIRAIKDRAPDAFPNSLADDCRILQLLNRIDEMSEVN